MTKYKGRTIVASSVDRRHSKVEEGEGPGKRKRREKMAVGVERDGVARVVLQVWSRERQFDVRP